MQPKRLIKVDRMLGLLETETGQNPVAIFRNSQERSDSEHSSPDKIEHGQDFSNTISEEECLTDTSSNFSERDKYLLDSDVASSSTDYSFSDYDQYLSDSGSEFDRNEAPDTVQDTGSFSAALATWAVETNCTRWGLNYLLSILRDKGLTELPKDARTLLKTPRSIPKVAKSGGD